MAKGIIATGDKYAGVDISWNRKGRFLILSGWYESVVGIAPEKIPLARFLSELGITLDDCKTALEEKDGE